jgi:hypothetical protein
VLKAALNYRKEHGKKFLATAQVSLAPYLRNRSRSAAAVLLLGTGCCWAQILHALSVAVQTPKPPLMPAACRRTRRRLQLGQLPSASPPSSSSARPSTAAGATTCSTCWCPLQSGCCRSSSWWGRQRSLRLTPLHPAGQRGALPAIGGGPAEPWLCRCAAAVGGAQQQPTRAAAALGYRCATPSRATCCCSPTGPSSSATLPRSTRAMCEVSRQQCNRRQRWQLHRNLAHGVHLQQLTFCCGRFAGLGPGQLTDFYLYIGDADTEACEGGAAAWASACDLGFRNRPVLGVANLCPGGFWSLPPDVQLSSMVHELLHALVSSAARPPAVAHHTA